MKAKLYKGPMHGKSLQIADSLIGSGMVTLMMKDPKAKGEDFYNAQGDLHVHVYAGVRAVHYQVKIVSAVVAGRTYYGPSIHPDGSIILTYAGGK